MSPSCHLLFEMKMNEQKIWVWSTAPSYPSLLIAWKCSMRIPLPKLVKIDPGQPQELHEPPDHDGLASFIQLDGEHHSLLPVTYKGAVANDVVLLRVSLNLLCELMFTTTEITSLVNESCRFQKFHFST